MRKALFILATSLSTALIMPAGAMPLAPIPLDHSASDIIAVRGGHGHGHGHGWGRGGHRAFGWSRGRKVGWRGHHCPPGHWKKGWC
ncbi:exported hypothetical protein [Bradyrhizobium sp. ORS 375]|uniref:hypothetical protein n=1 Tax=Bradyrhizobium sp. (strain ORS 375) TaxID=566679 RepID=UPI000240587A|nr:hypothetical protein [Bradyrhizobium sp. ORS 375]CCD94172.1 exported hypothetical protein [Bradyrhizobium sp. ORS 375]